MDFFRSAVTLQGSPWWLYSLTGLALKIRNGAVMGKRGGDSELCVLFIDFNIE